MIDKIEINNFKSWAGKNTIEFKSFTSIIGPNGSGKSNLLDAISFVLGITKGLRSVNVKELITTGLNDCYVTLYCSNDLVFSRKIVDQHSVYLLNQEKVSKQKYEQSLEQMGILVKARNFMVFQGDIESIANQKPKDLTNLIEQISGSIQYKQEFEELNQKLLEKNEISHQMFKKKQQIHHEVKVVQRQKVVVQKFDKLRNKRDLLNLKYWLLNVYELEKLEQDLGMEIELKNDSQLQDQLLKVKKELKTKRQDLANTQKQSIKLEQMLKQSELKEMGVQPEKVELNQEIEFNATKINGLQQELKDLKQSRETQTRDVEKLKLDLQNVNVALSKFDKEISSDKLQLSNSDKLEYTKLSHEFEQSTERREMNNIDREIHTLNDSQSRLQTELKSKKNERESLLFRQLELETNIAQTKESIKMANIKLEKNNNMLRNLNLERKRLNQLDTEKSDLLASVVNRLLEANSEQQESQRSRKFNETYQNLKRLYPGVKGKIMDLCKPTQRKFAVSVGICLGKNLEAIVVDTEKTGLDCIEYMRSQRCGTATFIPLDTITVSHQEKYRGIRGARMALDVLQFDSAYERAVKYCVGNTLVADDSDIAKQISRELEQKVKVVTLDGTIYHKTGNITGGSGEEVQNRWEQSEMEELARKKKVLQKEIEDIRLQKRKIEHDDELRGDVALGRAEVERLEDELASLIERNKGLDKEISHLDQPIQQIELDIKSVFMLIGYG